jgi:Tripartite tricarboxylate transporter family receptor
MKLARRKFLHLAADVPPAGYPPASPDRSTPLRCPRWPAQRRRTDILARLIGQWLSERLGQSFVIENRAGAGGTIAVDSVVRAPPDGYTLLPTAINDAYSEYLYPDLRYNYIRDITPVAAISLTPTVMEVNPSVQ